MSLLTEILDDAALLLRWLHVVAAMVWVGSAFALARLDFAMRSRESDAKPQTLFLHAGAGFRLSRADNADATEIPLNFRWETYAAWASGFVLLILTFCLEPSLYLVDSRVWSTQGWLADVLVLALLPLVWLAYDQMCKWSGAAGDRLLWLVYALAAALALLLPMFFTGRAAFLLIGVYLATIMAANIAHVIVPAQRRRLASLRLSEKADETDARAAVTRALHNQYLALPVVFFMLSSHAPQLVVGPHNGLAACGFLAAGFLTRRFFLKRSRGLGSDWALAVAAAVGVVFGLGV